jgi:anti-sigma factor RsiW
MSRLRLRPRRNIVCREAVELVTDYLEDALSQAQLRRFETHLAHCPDCPEYLAQMRAIVALAGRVTHDDLTPRMQEEFISLYRRWRDDEARDPL